MAPWTRQERCSCPLGPGSGLVFFFTAVTRPGGKALFTFEAQFPVSGCFGGLHLACDCFAVLLCNFFFLPLSCARSMSLMIFFSGKFQVCCHCCSANRKFAASLFPRLAKAESEDHGKSHFLDRILTSEIAELATKRQCLRTMS